MGCREGGVERALQKVAKSTGEGQWWSLNTILLSSSWQLPRVSRLWSLVSGLHLAWPLWQLINMNFTPPNASGDGARDLRASPVLLDRAQWSCDVNPGLNRSLSRMTWVGWRSGAHLYAPDYKYVVWDADWQTAGWVGLWQFNSSRFYSGTGRWKIPSSLTRMLFQTHVTFHVNTHTQMYCLK